jgi:isocitrate lyase
VTKAYIDNFAPIVADAEAGFWRRVECVRADESHDQLVLLACIGKINWSVKKCGHMGQSAGADG